MKKKKLFYFPKLSRYKNLIQAVSSQEAGNISFTHGQKREVLANRKKICRELGISLKNLYEMDQVHGSNIKVLKKEDIGRFKNNIVPQTDGLVTNQKQVFLMVKTADCFPVLFFDPVKEVIGAAHLGWRGVVGKIFLTVLLAMINNFQSQLTDLLVAIGPGIGACCFRHKNLIQTKLPEWEKFIKEEKNGWQKVDIGQFIKTKLVEAGVKEENIEKLYTCSSCSQYFFSHFSSLRKNKPEARFATIIGMK